MEKTYTQTDRDKRKYLLLQIGSNVELQFIKANKFVQETLHFFGFINILL